MRWRLLLVLLCLAAGVNSGLAADWPMWRHDPARSGSHADALPTELRLQWSRNFAVPQTAWPASQGKLRFDACPEPVVVEGHLLLGSTIHGGLEAFDTVSGKLFWRYFTDGPIRFAAAAADGRVFVASDDGCLHCVDLQNGRRIWRVRGGPSEKRIIGNERLISMWPARGAPVVDGGVVYFAAGIWPSMGVFIHAVDTETGRKLWTNSTTGSRFITHPHGADAFGSISPQGYLALTDKYVIVPGGRTLPGVFDRATGELIDFEFGGKGEGGFDVFAAGDFYVSRGELRRLADGTELGRVSAAVLSSHGLVGMNDDRIEMTSPAGTVTEKTETDRKGRKKKVTTFTPNKVSKRDVNGSGRVMLQAGSIAYVVKGRTIKAFDLNTPGTKKLEPVWSTELEATVSSVESLIAAEKRLFVSTLQKSGHPRLYCFGADPVQNDKPPALGNAAGRIAAVGLEGRHKLSPPVREFMKESDSVAGFAVSIGAPEFIELQDLLGNTPLRVVTVSLSAERGHDWRDFMVDFVEADRLRTLPVPLQMAGLPPYFASVVLCGTDRDWNEKSLARVFRILRPYGGTCYLKTTDPVHASMVRFLKKPAFRQAKVERRDEVTIIRRVGPLPESGVWTHQYGDASNSVMSSDARVKAPLGLLWFGGPSNDRVLPRHGHGPSPQVVGGRLFIEGVDILRCVDVYTGRVWWEREFPGLGTFYNNTSHQPGAGEIGSNYVSLEDHVYVIHGRELLELDARTGRTTREFSIDGKTSAVWGSLLVEGDRLIVTSSPVSVPDISDDEKKKDEKKAEAPPKPVRRVRLTPDSFAASEYSSASRVLTVFNRETGKPLWSREAEFNFRHNAICAAGDQVFCIDALSSSKRDAMRRRGIEPEGRPTLLALDAATGRKIWSTNENVFGTFLSYSREHDVLLQGGSKYRDRAKDEVGKGMVAYQGHSGDVIWQDLELSYGGPCLLRHDRIITNGGSGFELELLTGKKTGWSYQRMYGCNTAVGSEHLLTFRSGAAGFCDLAGDSGTGNLGGFRSSCTSNLIVADGVLNAPDYTRTCSCAYQLQTSLALVHMPELEFWTFGNRSFTEGPVDSIGINLGAPGDRRDESGVLWFDFPTVGGPSPKLDVKTSPLDAQPFARHSSLMDSGNLNWVGASGMKGIRTISVDFDLPKGAQHVSVRLVFSEPDGLVAGERVFDVSIEGQRVLSGFDVSAESNGDLRTVTRTFHGIRLQGDLDVELSPAVNSPGKQPVLSGVAVIVEKPSDTE